MEKKAPIYQCGITSAKIDNLVMFAQNTSALASKRDELYEYHWINHSTNDIYRTFIDDFLPIVKIAYKQGCREYITTTATEDEEFARFYCSHYSEWWNEHHQNGTLTILPKKSSKMKPKNSSSKPNNVELISLIEKLNIVGNRMELPQSFRFSKNEYAFLKSELTKAGGDYKKNGFEFKEKAQVVYDRIINGDDFNLKKKFQFFGTPDHLADRLVEYADIHNDDIICEPSAGQGAIVHAINRILPNKEVICFELMDLNKIELNNIPTALIKGNDFLKYNAETLFTKIIANPPFNKNQDIDHIYHMYKNLSPGGRLVSIASKHWQHSSNKKELQFAKWLKDIKAKIHELPPGEFNESGTSIASVIIIINKV